jgi:hypothetical protein
MTTRSVLLAAGAAICFAPTLALAANDVPFPMLPDPTSHCERLRHTSDADRYAPAARADFISNANACLRRNQEGYETAKRLWPELSERSAKYCQSVLLQDSRGTLLPVSKLSDEGYAVLGDCAGMMYGVDLRDEQVRQNMQTPPPFVRD